MKINSSYGVEPILDETYKKIYAFKSFSTLPSILGRGRYTNQCKFIFAAFNRKSKLSEFPYTYEIALIQR